MRPLSLPAPSGVEMPSTIHSMDTDSKRSTRFGDKEKSKHKTSITESCSEHLSFQSVERSKCLEMPTGNNPTESIKMWGITASNITAEKKFHDTDNMNSPDGRISIQEEEKVEICYWNSLIGMKSPGKHAKNVRSSNLIEVEDIDNTAATIATNRERHDADMQDLAFVKHPDSDIQIQGGKKVGIICNNASEERHAKNVRWSNVIEIKDIKFVLGPRQPSTSEIAGQRLHLEAMERRKKLMSRRKIYNNKGKNNNSKTSAINVKNSKNVAYNKIIIRRGKLSASEIAGCALHAKGAKMQKRLASLRKKYLENKPETPFEVTASPNKDFHSNSNMKETKNTKIKINPNNNHIIRKGRLTTSEKSGRRMRLEVLTKKYHKKPKLHFEATAQTSQLLSRKDLNSSSSMMKAKEINTNPDDEHIVKQGNLSISEKAGSRLFLEATKRMKRLSSLRNKPRTNNPKLHFEAAAQSSLLLSRKELISNSSMKGGLSTSEKAGGRLYLEATKMRKRLESLRNKNHQKPKLHFEAAAQSSLLLSRKDSNSKRGVSTTDALYVEATKRRKRLASLWKQPHKNQLKLHCKATTQSSLLLSKRDSNSNRSASTAKTFHVKATARKKRLALLQNKYHTPRSKSGLQAAAQSSLLVLSKKEFDLGRGASTTEALYAEATARKERLASLKKKHHIPRPKLQLEAAAYSSRLLLNVTDRDTIPCHIRLYKLARCDDRRKSSVDRRRREESLCTSNPQAAIWHR